MAEVLNKNVERNYLKNLHFKDDIVDQLKRQFTGKGDQLIEYVLTQNKKVLQDSSKIYDSFIETKEKTQNEVLKLDLVLDQVRSLKSTVRGGVTYTGDIDLTLIFGAFDDKIRDLEDSIKKSEEAIQEEKKLKSSNSEKIKDIVEYMNKFILEKRLYLDKVVEEDIIDQSKKFFLLKPMMMDLSIDSNPDFTK